MKSKPSDPEQELIDEIHDIHASAWATAAPPASIEAANERVMLDAMRKLSLELLRRGVTTAVMEGAYLMWWLRLACINHGFAEGGFERSLRRIGPLVGPVSNIMMRLGEAVGDEEPRPEMQRLGEKLEALRGLHGGSVVTQPKSREEEDAQTETAHTLIQGTVLAAIDVGIPPAAIESMLLYFWFRCTANRHGLKEAFFQKVERHWSVVMERTNRSWERGHGTHQPVMSEQATADRQCVQGDCGVSHQ